MPTSSTRSGPSSSSSSAIRATIQGWEIVWPSADPQRAVAVGVAAQLVGHELLARHLGHRLQHPLVGDLAPAQLALDHALARCAQWMKFRSLAGSCTVTFPAQRDDALALQGGEEAAGALARRAGERGDLGLRGPHQHVLLGGALGLAGDDL